ncbi:hypothetical protein RRG08_022490 [Elysia crispata]|uniref:G-protein coupled receptors family 1 profile domain-containing protein n=1 Tax=Elysia crispata TaxID=231223 RepID=A0AAE1D8D2_9GAST|nr:hypothetical protein RRG08_022490 [Elysia crispata]
MVACLNITRGEMVSMNDTLGEEATAAVISRVINKIALPSVCAFGVVGNILNLMILTRQKHQTSFRRLEQAANLCLIALALSTSCSVSWYFPTFSYQTTVATAATEASWFSTISTKFSPSTSLSWRAHF